MQADPSDIYLSRRLESNVVDSSDGIGGTETVGKRILKRTMIVKMVLSRILL
jgi:hypothetical protein